VSDEREDRILGPDMVAEGWIVVGGDWIMWLHPPSKRCVVIEGPMPRKTQGVDSMAIPAVHGEPSDPATEGYLVICSRNDQHGNPIAGDSFWVESYGEAVRRGRAIRQSILDAKRPVDGAEQLTFDNGSKR
jgi:hypothetical protein